MPEKEEGRIEWAIDLLIKGEKLRRVDWCKGAYIQVGKTRGKHKPLLYSSGRVTAWQVLFEDVIADDWMVIE